MSHENIARINHTTEPSGRHYQELNGTYYNEKTDACMICLLESLRRRRIRCHFHLGDTQSGQAWGDIETGTIGRSTGRIKMPLVIARRDSSGGPGLLDSCIVKIVNTKTNRDIYMHPDYKPQPAM
jgi:hypothetical protein